MKFTSWLLVGLGIIAINFLARVLFSSYIKSFSRGAVRFGKKWGKTTSRFKVLRVLNTFFYILGLSITFMGLLIGLFIISPINPQRAQVHIKVVPKNSVLEAKELLRLVNVQRQMNGLKPLNEDNRLNAIAHIRATDMLNNEYYAHRSPDGLYYYDYFDDFKMAADYSCENLDVEFTVDESVYISDWLNSSKGHRECMLNPNVTSAGYAVIRLGDSPATEVYLAVGIHTTAIKIVD